MSLPSPNDLELVRGLHARDPKVLARVYGDYHAAVYNLCARILGDREEAKDVTQDVFLKAFSKPPAATEDVRLRPWLFRVATNACFNLIRGRRSGGPIEADALAAGGDPFEQARTAALIESSLAGMNERYRAALVLKDLHGLEGSELAEVLEVSRPAADVLVHRARAAFRRVFAGLAGEDAIVPANLALALPLLPVPVALQALPLPGPAQAPPPAGAQPGAAPGAPGAFGPLTAATATAASGAGPAAGLLTKIGAALSTKAAVVAAGAAVVAGGGAAAVKLAGDEQTVPPASAGSRPAAVHDGAAGGHSASEWDDDWHEHRHHVAARLTAHHAAESARHAAGVHDGKAEEGTEAHQTGDEDHTSTTTRDSVTHDSTTPASSDTTSAATGDHDGGSAGHDEDGER
jgi:RNA polymerase sigma factor (sigma-70 family)